MGRGKHDRVAFPGRRRDLKRKSVVVRIVRKSTRSEGVQALTHLVGEGTQVIPSPIEIRHPPEPRNGMVSSGLIRGRIPIVVDEFMLGGVPKVTVLQAVAEHDGVGSSVRHGGHDCLGRIRVENHNVGGVAAGGVQRTIVVRTGRINVGGVRIVGGTEEGLNGVWANRDAISLPAGGGLFVTVVGRRG